MQDLWRRQLSWDELLCGDLLKRWTSFNHILKGVGLIKIPRWLGTTMETQIQIHGFADASKHAYAAVVYARASQADGRGDPRILTAKTRVAPVRTITIPRLELCAAVLLKRLIEKVISSMNRRIDSIRAWSDSQVALAWIAAEPSRWSVFVSNRVSEIQSSIFKCEWHYVHKTLPISLHVGRILKLFLTVNCGGRVRSGWLNHRQYGR